MELECGTMKAEKRSRREHGGQIIGGEKADTLQLLARQTWRRAKYEPGPVRIRPGLQVPFAPNLMKDFRAGRAFGGLATTSDDRRAQSLKRAINSKAIFCDLYPHSTHVYIVPSRDGHATQTPWNEVRGNTTDCCARVKGPCGEAGGPR